MDDIDIAGLDIPQIETQLLALARQAGAAILPYYEAPFDPAQIQQKPDQSPLTAADLAAHQQLAAGLPQILAVPVISEESPLPDYAERSRWEAYWLVDPLDGTREFLQRRGEFTVNIALIYRGHPILGLVHLPVGDESWFGWNPRGGDGRAARKYLANRCLRSLSVRVLNSAGELTVLASLRHGTDALIPMLQRLTDRWTGTVVKKSVGSSLKFCWLAEGQGDLYPRLSPTMEWDSAAAQAILEAAGGAVIEADALANGHWRPLGYNKPCVINPSFYAMGDVNVDWQKILV